MDVFPAYFPLTARRVVVAGAGDAADAKARLFEGSPAQLIRPTGEDAFDPDTYAGAVLAFVGSDDDAFIVRAVAAAHAAHVPVNVADRPALCDFTTPAVIDRGEVVAAIGTGGAAPLLAALLRADIEARVPEGAGWVAALLRKLQGEVRDAFPDVGARRAFLRSVLAGPAADAALAGDLERAEDLMREAIAAGMDRVGRFRLVPGSGPAETLTLKAARVLAEADVLAAEDGVDLQVAILARRDARRVSGPDASPEALAALARQGMQVVWLVAGDLDAQIQALGRLGLEVEAVR